MSELAGGGDDSRGDGAGTLESKIAEEMEARILNSTSNYDGE